MQIHIVGGGAWPLCTLCCGFGCALHLCCICIRTATSVKLLSRCHSTCFGQHSCTCPPTDGQVAKATQHTLQSPRAAGHHSMSGFYCVLAMNKSISGLVAEYIVAIDVTRAQFPADACSQLPAGAAASPRHDVAAFAAPSLSPWHLWQRLHHSGQGHGRLVCVGLLPGLVDAASTSVAYSSAAEAVHCKRLSPCTAGGARCRQ